MSDTRKIALIDYVSLAVPLETSPNGNLWEVIAVTRNDGAGLDACQVAVVDGQSAAVLDFRGPSLVDLDEPQLEREAERMRRVQEAAGHALRAIEQQLATRRGG